MRTTRFSTRPAVVLLACFAVASPAAAQSLDAMSSDVEVLQGRLTQLEEEFLRPIVLEQTMTMTSRLADGQARYYIGDYESAAIVLVDIVENERYRGELGYDDARYMLADSLYRSRNFVMARSYFEEIVEDNDPVYGLDAARGLLEVAFAMGRYDGLEELYANLQQQRGTMGPEIAYVRGKALYFQGDYDAARSAFGGIPADSDLYIRARYFIGVIMARDSDYAGAMGEFERVLSDLQPTDADDPDLTEAEEELRDLAYLAKGRIFYEQQAWDDAINTYAYVPRNSLHFDDALYEISWTLIREERYAEAVQNLEILALVADSESIAAEAELLRGDLLMRSQDYEEAVESFELVADRYEPLQLEMREMLEGRSDAAEYFEALVNPESGALRIPQIAQQWVDDELIVERALNLVRDIAFMWDTLEQSRAVLEQLDTALSNASGVDVFPRTREGWGSALELLNASISLRVQLVDAEYSYLTGMMPSDAEAQYQQLRDRRERLQAEWEDVPQTLVEMENREVENESFLEELVLEVYRAEMEIQLVRDQIESVRLIIGEQVRAGERTREEMRPILDELDEMEADLEIREDEAEDLRLELERSELVVGVTQDDATNENDLRRRLLDALRLEVEFLAGYRGANSARSSEFARLTTLHQRLDAVDDGVVEMMESLEDLVGEQTEQYRAILEEERELLSRYERQLAMYERQASLMAGEIAHQSFIDVQARLEDLTLRANLGIIDVAWREKEELTDEIDQLFTERNRALRILDADFSELLVDE